MHQLNAYKTVGLCVLAIGEALHYVLEQDTLSSA